MLFVFEIMEQLSVKHIRFFYFMDINKKFYENVPTCHLSDILKKYNILIWPWSVMRLVAGRVNW